MNKTVEMLNNAFESDPNAIHTLLCNRVPCNKKLADDPFVVVCDSPVLTDGNCQVGALGLINAVLDVNDLPLVCIEFSDDGRLTGFREYEDKDKEITIQINKELINSIERLKACELDYNVPAGTNNRLDIWNVLDAVLDTYERQK